MIAAHRRPDEAKRIAALRRYDVLDSAPESGLDDLIELVATTFGTASAAISLVDTDRQWFKATYGMTIRETPREVSFCDHVVSDAKLMVVRDALQDRRFADNPLVLDNPGVRFYAGVPLMSGDGYPLGSVCALDSVPRNPTPHQLKTLELVSSHVTQWFELRRKVNRARHFERLFDLSNSLICIYHMDGQMLQVSPSWSRLFGIWPEELPSTPLLGRTHPDDLTEVYSRINTLSAGGSTANVAVRSLVADGTWRWLSWSAVPDLHESVVYSIGVDVTEQRQIQHLRDELVSTVSHELRTPLTAIRGSLGLLSNASLDKAAQEELLSIATANTDRLIRLVNDLLDLDQLEARGLRLNIGAASIDASIASVFEVLAPVARDARVTLSAATSGQQIMADADRLAQILTNLLSNAIRHAPADSVVAVSVERRGPTVRVIVADEGAGIALEDQTRLFMRFSQVDAPNSNHKSGSGLGLAIVRGLVEQHGGAVGLDSAPGRGARFWFELDAANPAETPTGP